VIYFDAEIQRRSVKWKPSLSLQPSLHDLLFLKIKYKKRCQKY